MTGGLVRRALSSQPSSLPLGSFSAFRLHGCFRRAAPSPRRHAFPGPSGRAGRAGGDGGVGAVFVLRHAGAADALHDRPFAGAGARGRGAGAGGAAAGAGGGGGAVEPGGVRERDLRALYGGGLRDAGAGKPAGGPGAGQDGGDHDRVRADGGRAFRHGVRCELLAGAGAAGGGVRAAEGEHRVAGGRALRGGPMHGGRTRSRFSPRRWPWA